MTLIIFLIKPAGFRSSFPAERNGGTVRPLCADTKSPLLQSATRGSFDTFIPEKVKDSCRFGRGAVIAVRPIVLAYRFCTVRSLNFWLRATLLS